MAGHDAEFAYQTKEHSGVQELSLMLVVGHTAGKLWAPELQTTGI